MIILIRKTFQSALIIILAIGVILGNNITFAHSGDGKECNCSEDTENLTKEKVLQKLNEVGVIVNENPPKEDVQKAEKVLKKEKDYQLALKTLKKDGYKISKDTVDYIQFKNLGLGEFYYENIIVVAGLLQNGDTFANFAAWIDIKNEQIIKYNIIKISENGEWEDLVSYEKLTENSSGFSTMGFQTDWGSFTCTMAGLFTCIHYCGIWTLVNPAAGVICDIACGIAFGFACSTSGN